MMSPKQISEDRGGLSTSSSIRHTPLQIIHVFSNFTRIWSIYLMYNYLSQQGASAFVFIFSCLVPSMILFLTLQKPWKGRPLNNQQVISSVINGGIMALYFISWTRGLKSCGPMRAIMAEYGGAVLGVLSTVLYGRKGHIWKKVGGLVAMMASFYFLSQGWAMATYSPFTFKDSIQKEGQIEEVVGMKQMVVPILAGILSALRRVVARRMSLKVQLKRRLHAITIASTTCFLFPLAMWDLILRSPSDSDIQIPFLTWTYFSTVLFGIVLISYIDSIAEERLHIVFSSPRHLAVAAGCIIVLEILYKLDFSLVGFLICSVILGFGIFEATSLERVSKDPPQPLDETGGTYVNENNELPLRT